MSKFTEGPWKLRGNNIGVADVSETQSYGMLINIAYVDEFDLASDWQANANLIAAAPDMYNVLERLMEQVATDPYYEDIIERVLAKARGET